MNLPLQVLTPWVLALLPLALLPWLLQTRESLVHAWIDLLPLDPLSVWLDRALRALASVAIAATVLALAGLHRAEYPVERVGRGAEIVMMLDRSRSMDQGLVSAAGSKPGGLENQLAISTREGRPGDRPSKGIEARRILGAFAAQRPDDRFAMLTFSTLPIPIHDFTDKQDVVQAAIAAGAIGRGLAETDIGAALLRGLDWFKGRPYTGSRILLLVSDGGDHITADTREEITRLMRAYRVSLYWVYIRSPRSPKLADDKQMRGEYSETIPEYFLHRYFQSTGVPYRAYEADDPESLEQAIADVGHLQNLPITTIEMVPRRDLANAAYGVALAAVLLLLLARGMELRSWA